MNFCMEGENVKLEFAVREYVPSKLEVEDYNWCKIDFTFKHLEGIDYTLLDDETLCAHEVESLEHALGELIDGTGEYRKEISFIEPYFEFILTRDLDDYIKVEWIVKLWTDGSPSDCYFSVPLYQEEIESLLEYLRDVMKR